MIRVRPGKAVTLIAALVCMLATAILAANLNNIPVTSDTASISTYLSSLTAFLFPATFLLWCIVLVVTFFKRDKTRSAKRVGEHERLPATFWGMVLVLAAVLILSITFQTGLIDKGVLSGGSTPVDEADEEVDDNKGPVTAPDLTIFSLLPLILILIIAFWLSYRRFKVKRDGSPILTNRYPEQIAVVDRAMAAIGEGGDVRGAIFQAYYQMCHLVTGPLSDNATLTPRELEDGLVHDLGWPLGPVHRLTRMFELARYSDHPLAEEDRHVALRSLSELRSNIGGVNGQ